jgi:hypothetical protein
MTDGEPQKSDVKSDPGGPPSLSELAERVQQDPGRDDYSVEDTGAIRPNGGSDSTTPRTYEDSEFFFPAGSPSGVDAPSDEMSPAVTESTDEMSPAVTESTDETTPDRVDESGERFGPDAKTEAILELTGDVQNLLIKGPPNSPAEYELCANLMVPRDDPPEHLFLVTFEKSPDERLNILRGNLGTLPSDIAILNVGGGTRSRSTDLVTTTGADGIAIDNLTDPTDVQRMGLTINKYLSEWEGDGETVLCFHSLTALLNAVDSKTVFRFLNVLMGRVRSGEIRAHYHIDPGAHGDQTLETYRPLFDEQLRVKEDGSVRVDR